MMRVTLSHCGGMNFAAAADGGPRVQLSGAPDIGDPHGNGGAGPRPMEMVLMGLGGCSGIDVLSILNKARLTVTAFDIDIEAERASQTPAVFTRIHLHYRLRGAALDRHKVTRAVALSMEKYCSVTRMLEKTAAISYEVSIDGDGDNAGDGDGDNIAASIDNANANRAST